MGSRLAAYFEEAERLGGVLGKVRLSGMTRMTTTQALATEDAPDVVALFERALAQLRAEAQRPGERLPARGEAAPGEVARAAADAATLRHHLRVYLDLMTQRALLQGELLETARRVNEAASDALGVARVGVWLLDAERTRLTLLDLFEREGRAHSAGLTLDREEAPAYFAALLTERTIAAHDALADPRTRGFSAGYLTPLGIGAVLDVPIWAGGRMVGVVCHEHVGRARTWNADEEQFAYLMAAFVALTAERVRDVRTTPGRD